MKPTETPSGELPAPAPSAVSPDAVRSELYQLTPGEDVITPALWAGSIPHVGGIAPRIRIGRSRWFNLLWLLPLGFVALLAAVAVAQGLRNVPSVQRFITAHPGTVQQPHPTVTGFPAWVGWQHFFNLFLLIFIIRSGIQILADHPRLYWTRHSTPGRDWFRMQEPVPSDPLWTAKQDSISLPRQVGLPGLRHTIGLARWWHLGIDALWLLNGVVFYILLFATGQWHRLVPTTWEVFPNALSTLIQYLSLNWPNESGWVAYNGLQLIAYFITVFVAAPLALITGLGMSPALSTRFKRTSRIFGIQTARSLHFLVLAWFVVFIVMHVTFVFSTGTLVNLNHVYAGRNDHSWVGFVWFAASMVVVVVGWVAATPFTIAHPRVVQRVGQAIVGPLQHFFEHVDPKAGEYPRPTSPRTSGTTASTRTPTSTSDCSTPTSSTTGSTSTAWSTIPSTWISFSSAPCPTTSRSPSISASKAGRASPNGVACRCRPSWTWSSRIRKRSGWSSTPSVTAPTKGPTTTPTPSSTWPIT